MLGAMAPNKTIKRQLAIPHRALVLHEQFFSLSDGRGHEFAIYLLRGFQQILQAIQGSFSRIKRLLATAVVLVGEIASKRGAATAETQTPTLEGGVFVGEAGEISLGSHRA